MAGIMHLPHNQLRYLQVELEKQSSRLEYKTSLPLQCCVPLLFPGVIHPPLFCFVLPPKAAENTV